MDPRADEFMRLFTRHQPRLYGYILSLVPHWNDAEEVLQETSVVLWSKFSQFQPGTNFFAWACQIARLEILKLRRQPHRRHLILNDQLQDLITRDTLALAEELHDRQRALQECLEQLREPDRRIIESRYYAGQTVQSLANETGRSADAIYKAINRIRARLLYCIEQAVGSSRPEARP